MTTLESPRTRAPAEQPRRGGTLRLVGAGDVDHLDPALAYHTVTRGVVRACTRQLVTYRSTDDVARAGDLVPDLATFERSGCAYRFTLKDGVAWDDGRPVTAADVARGIKRLAHPLAPSPGLSYFLSTVAGLAPFRDALLAGPRDPAAIAAAIESAEVPGLRVESERTLVVTTVEPVSDFLNILALPFATPAPVASLEPRPWNGPYRIVDHRPGERIRLERNPHWSAASDDVRAAYVDAIDVEEGVDEDEAYLRVLDGTADLLWDTQPPTERLPELFATNDPRLRMCLAGLLSPYLVINMLSPNERGATARLQVRQALRHAVDKAAVSTIWGGPRLNTIAQQVLPPLSSAHRPVEETAPPEGDPERARRLLAAAGYRDGLTLRLVFRNRDIHPATAEAVRASLARAGIDVELVPAPIESFFADYLASAAAARAGAWDIALSGWEPDWNGNNARVYLQPLFDSSNVSDDDWGTNFGHYANARVDALLAEGLRSQDARRANRCFAAVERQVMHDVAIVPILFAHQYWLHSSRVHGWLPYPVLNGDPTNLWLDQTA
jgi:peptide/nickel transport system substrate-binding protein